MSIDFKDIFRLKISHSNCIQKNLSFSWFSFEGNIIFLHSLSVFLFLFLSSCTLGRSERAGVCCICFFFIFKAFRIFFNNIFCSRKKRKKYQELRKISVKTKKMMNIEEMTVDGVTSSIMRLVLAMLKSFELSWKNETKKGEKKKHTNVLPFQTIGKTIFY